MKKIITIATLLIASLHALEKPIEEDSSALVYYRYVKLSDQWGIFPGLGLCYRYHHKKQGFNIDLTAYSYWEAGFSLYGKGHYLFYPTQNYFYLGIGAGVIGGWFSANYFINSIFRTRLFIKPTLEGIFGCEWNTKKRSLFLQLEAGMSYGEVSFYPVLSFGVGF